MRNKEKATKITAKFLDTALTPSNIASIQNSILCISILKSPYLLEAYMALMCEFESQVIYDILNGKGRDAYKGNQAPSQSTDYQSQPGKTG